MGAGSSDHQQEQQQQQQQQQYRMGSSYEASAASSSHDPGALRQQHFVEGGFFPWASLRSASIPVVHHPSPQAIPSYFRSQQQHQEQLLRSTTRDEAAAPGNLMEMALNVRGMNVIPLAQRPPSSVLEDHHHQLQQYMHHQQQQQQQQHQQQLLQRSASVPVASLMSSPRATPGGAPGAILHHLHEQQAQAQIQFQHLQQQQQQMQLVTSSSSTGASGGSTCKECGNQAKKDCSYQRCRTCCKSRGFECSTHVRSTWVPAAKRRERQMVEAAAIASGQPRPKSKRNRAIAMQQQQEQLGELGPGGDQLQLHHHHHHHQLQNPGASQLTGGAALEEDLQGTTTTTTSNSPSDARQSQSDMGGLPSEVRAQAVFKCVKVTRVDNGEDEYAYQAVVRIGGRVFKGVLQDHGSDAGTSGETTSLAAGSAALGVPAIGGAAVAAVETPPQLLQLDPAPGSGGGLFGSSDPKELFREN